MAERAKGVDRNGTAEWKRKGRREREWGRGERGGMRGGQREVGLGVGREQVVG